MGMQHLGGHAFYISPQEVGLGTRESVPGIVARALPATPTASWPVLAHDHVVQLAQWASVPVINGLSDYDHPCQALTDLFTIWEYFGQLAGLTLVFAGDGSNNVATGLIMAALAKSACPCASLPPKAISPTHPLWRSPAPT